MRPLARVVVSTQRGVPVATLEGEVDITNAADVRAQILAAVPNGAPGVVVDLTPTTYLDSRGVHLLLELAERLRRSQQALGVVCPPESVIRRTLTLAHLDQVVPVHTTVEAAVETIG